MKIRYEYTAAELAEHEIWREWGKDFIPVHRRLAIIEKKLDHAVAVYSTEPGDEGIRLDWQTPYGVSNALTGILRQQYLKRNPRAKLYEVFYYSVDHLREYLKPVHGPCSICGAHYSVHNPTLPFSHLLHSFVSSWLLVCVGCNLTLQRQMRKYGILSSDAAGKELFDIVLAVKANELKLAIDDGRRLKSIAGYRKRQKDQWLYTKRLEKEVSAKREAEERRHKEWYRGYLLRRFARFALKFYRRDKPIIERMARRKRIKVIRKIAKFCILLRQQDREVKQYSRCEIVSLPLRQTRREQRLAWHRSHGHLV